jgi:hypothetical protein
VFRVCCPARDRGDSVRPTWIGFVQTTAGVFDAKPARDIESAIRKAEKLRARLRPPGLFVCLCARRSDVRAPTPIERINSGGCKFLSLAGNREALARPYNHRVFRHAICGANNKALSGAGR